MLSAFIEKKKRSLKQHAWFYNWLLLHMEILYFKTIVKDLGIIDTSIWESISSNRPAVWLQEMTGLEG